MSDTFYSRLRNPTTVQTGTSCTISAGQYAKIDSTAGAYTATLVSAPADATAAGVKLVASATPVNQVTVTCGGADKFNLPGGPSTLPLKLLNQGVQLQYNASAGVWDVHGDDLPLGGLDGRYGQLATAGTYTADQYFKSGRPWFDVIAFGADPTGVADSTTAIQTAIYTAIGLRTDTGVSMSGFTVTDSAAVSGDAGKYVNSPNYPAITSYPVGVTASNATMQITGVASAPFVANQPVVLTAASAPAGFTANTTYFILSPSQVSTTFSFSLSATSGGSAITPTSTGTTVGVQQVTGGCSLIASVTPGVGYTVTTPAAASLSGQVVAIGTGSSVAGRIQVGPVFLPAGVYKITRDLLIQSVDGLRFFGTGGLSTTLQASGGGFTTAVLNIDGSLDGDYGGFQVKGDGTEGTGGVSGSGVPNAINLTFTTSSARSTTANTIQDIRIRNLRFLTGVSLAGIGARQLDGTQLRNIVVAGQQIQGGWSTAARTDTGLCSTNTATPTTVGDTAAVTADLGLPIAGPGIPGGTKITAVSAGTGYTISQNVTATASGVTFTVGTGFWQQGFVFGNGTQGNIYDQAAYGCTAAGCYYGYYCAASSFALFSAQPGSNAIDFWLVPDAQVTVENVQSQASGQFIVCPAGGTAPVGFRDCEFIGWTGSHYNNAWISIGTSYGNWVLDNMRYAGALVAPAPVIACDSADYNAGFTLISIMQPNTPSAGIVPGGTSSVICLNYQDITAGPGPASTLYPFYAVNCGVLFQQGTAAARPAASAFGEMFYWATDTSVFSHSSGTAWTALGAASVTAPDIQVFTSTGTWTKPTSPAPVTTEVVLIAPGGGGGSGRQGAVSTLRCGGGGGAGGQVLRKLFKTADLTSTVTVTVPGQQNGGAAQASADSNGSSGTGFVNTVFGVFCSAIGGQGGGGGTATAGAGGSMFLPSAVINGAGAGANTAGPGASPNTAGLTAPGGPSGGSITAANVPGAGAGGGTSVFGSSTGAGAAGVVDSTAPTSGTGTAVNGAVGTSAGSGAASITTAAQAGADATTTSYGVGGAGGGASLDGNASGAGGKGGAGFVMVVSYYQ